MTRTVSKPQATTILSECCWEMNVQVIMREGQPEYAVLPWAEYQALLQAARQPVPAVKVGQASQPAAEPAVLASLAQLKELREAKGLSVEQLAKSVGVSPHYLALIEQGVREPGAVIERGLAQALGITGWEPKH